MKTTLTALLTVVGLAVLGSVESKPKEALGPQAKGRWMSPNLDGAKKCDMVEGKECFLKSSSAPRCCPVKLPKKFKSRGWDTKKNAAYT